MSQGSEPEVRPRRYIRDTAVGNILMRCPICHQGQFVSEFQALRPDALCHCRWCADSRAVLEPVLDDRESPADRLRRVPA